MGCETAIDCCQSGRGAGGYVACLQFQTHAPFNKCVWQPTCPAGKYKFDLKDTYQRAQAQQALDVAALKLPKKVTVTKPNPNPHPHPQP